MSQNKESVVLSLLQPDLLTETELIEQIQAEWCKLNNNSFALAANTKTTTTINRLKTRRCKIKNLRLMNKEGLVEIFRRFLLPLPQRFYRSNRRGKMLTSRRAKSGHESKRKDEGSTSNKGRLKPPPETSNSNKIKLNLEKTKDSNNYQIKDRRKTNDNDEEMTERKTYESNSSSTRKISLKRHSEHSSSHERERKTQRTAIKWP